MGEEECGASACDGREDECWVESVGCKTVEEIAGRMLRERVCV